jgi:hypothetical protein
MPVSIWSEKLLLKLMGRATGLERHMTIACLDGGAAREYLGALAQIDTRYRR